MRASSTRRKSYQTPVLQVKGKDEKLCADMSCEISVGFSQPHPRHTSYDLAPERAQRRCRQRGQTDKTRPKRPEMPELNIRLLG